jgi:hypothetical protein
LCMCVCLRERAVEWYTREEGLDKRGRMDQGEEGRGMRYKTEC